MKIRPRFIASSQKIPNNIHGSSGLNGTNGCNGMLKTLKLLNCTGTPSRSPVVTSDSCFGRITVCEINCSHNSNNNNNYNNNSNNNHCDTTPTTTTTTMMTTTTAVNGSLNSFGMGNGNGNNTIYMNNHTNGNSSCSNSNANAYTTTTVTTTATNINNTHTNNSFTTITKNTHSDKNNHIYAYALISFIAVMVYLNGINGDFVHDDIPAITLNKDVIGINKITRSFFNDFWGTPMDDANSHKSYRPLTVLSFRLNYYLFGLKPIWFHFTNILMHAIVCVLFTRVCIIVAGLQDNFAIIAGIIFAVHPIHSEAVTGIVGRADILACIFFLISLLVYHGKAYSTDDTSTWLSILFGGISMLSKETGITVFLVNLTYDLYRCWPSLKRTLVDVHWTPESQQCYRRLSKLLISMGILLIIRLALLQGSFPKFSQQDNPTAYHPSFYVRMLTFCYLAAFNWWLVLCPSTLSHDWQMGSIPLLTSISDPRNLLTLWAFASTILMLHRSLLDFESQRYAPLILGVLLLILPFLPATNLFVTVGFVVAERVLYIPSLGCVLLVVYGAQIMWETMSKYRSFIILMGILLITVGTCKTITRNRDWYSRECLLRAGLRVLPHNAKMHYNFGNFLKDSFQHDTAKQHYREALRLWPTYASAHNNLGTLVSNLDVAENHFLSAIMYASTHVNAHFNLGQLYLKKNRTNDAIRMFKRCTEIDATYVQAHLELFRLHRESQAALILSDAIKANPDNVELRLAFGHWLLNNGLAPAAMQTFRYILEKDVSNKLAITGICKSMRKLGQWSRLHLLMSRLQTIYRLAHGGQSYKIDIYLRNWSIRTELKRRAYLYNIENESFPQPELSVPTERQPTNMENNIINNTDNNNKTKNTDTNSSNSLSMMTTSTMHPINFTGISGQHHDIEMYKNTSNAEINDRDHEQKTNEQDLLYQKQYCNQIKNLQTDMMHTNGVNIAAHTEINTTTRKMQHNNHDDHTVEMVDGKNCEMIVYRCGTWNKNVRNCSEKKIAIDAKSVALPTTQSTTKFHDITLKKSCKMCPFNPLNKCEIGKSNKSPNLKTQNTFISRLFLTDILDNI